MKNIECRLVCVYTIIDLVVGCAISCEDLIYNSLVASTCFTFLHLSSLSLDEVCDFCFQSSIVIACRSTEFQGMIHGSKSDV